MAEGAEQIRPQPKQPLGDRQDSHAQAGPSTLHSALRQPNVSSRAGAAQWNSAALPLETAAATGCDQEALEPALQPGTVPQPAEQAGPSQSAPPQQAPGSSNAELSIEEYLQKHHLGLYVSDMVSLLLQAPADVAADAVRFAADYLAAVVTGKHVVGRSFLYIQASPHNRRTFLGVAKRSLANVHRMGDLGLEDMHSLLALLCPDLPLRIVKSAFKAALGVWPQAPPLTGPPGPLRLSFDRLFRCLEVTFLYEKYLLELRNQAFGGRSHLPKVVQSIREAAVVVDAAVTRQGWCAPPAAVVEDALQEADRAMPGTNAAMRCPPSEVHFDALVRGLCASERMRQHLQLEHAAAVLAARTNASLLMGTSHS